MKIILFAVLSLSAVAVQATEVTLEDLCYTKSGRIGYIVRPDDPFEDSYCSSVGGESGCGSDGELCQMNSGKLGQCVRTGEGWNERSYCSPLWTDKD